MDAGAHMPEAEQLTDVRRLRALTHPVRIALLETLALDGPQTATEAGERVGESPTTCSFHLRQLAKYGFVEEAGSGPGRRRPWKLSHITTTTVPLVDDPEAQVASRALGALLRERMLGRYRQWIETESAYPRDWRSAAGDTEALVYLTAAELAELREELLRAILPLCLERLEDPAKRPAGSLPVEFLILAYPVKPPPAREVEAAEAREVEPPAAREG